MTYNFDPDKWYYDQLSILQTMCRNGEKAQEKYDLAVFELDCKLAAMWEWLDAPILKKPQMIIDFMESQRKNKASPREVSMKQEAV